jgi:protein ImuA
MVALKADIISQLRKEILSLQGFKNKATEDQIRPRLGVIDASFPNAAFPLASIHEFLTGSAGDLATTSGFIAYLLSSLMGKEGVSIWISSMTTIFPAGLKLFGINPEKIIFITASKEKEKLWIMEEALKCEGLAAVVGEIRDLDFTASRRLQLAVEATRVTGFVIRNDLGNKNVNGCTARWKISSLPSGIIKNLPGIGFPRWNIELLKIRNGKPGTWQMEWSYNNLHTVTDPLSIEPSLLQQRKTG